MPPTPIHPPPPLIAGVDVGNASDRPENDGPLRLTEQEYVERFQERQARERKEVRPEDRERLRRLAEEDA